MSMMTKRIDQRGVAKRLKEILPPRVFRALTVSFNRTFRQIPNRPKYALGHLLRRRKFPYSLLRPGDVVVQIGAPRDILCAGRSRAVYFSLAVGETGKVITVEPDPESFATLSEFVRKHGLEGRFVLFNCGAWSERKQLTLLSSPDHPAANRVAEAAQTAPELIRERRYKSVTIPVDSVDSIIRAAGVGRPRLVSITTNGSEREILKGMRETIAVARPYLSVISTGATFFDDMKQLGYSLLARDDRGSCFQHNSLVEAPPDGTARTG